MSAPPAAEALRARLIAAAEDAYEDAGFAGLCAEGRWERALDAMRALDLTGPDATPNETPGGSPTDAAPFDGGEPPATPSAGPPAR